MKKSLIIFVCLIAILGFTGCGNSKKKDNIEKTNSGVIDDTVSFEDQVIRGLSFEKFAISRIDDISNVYFEVVNRTEENIDVGTIKFTLYSSGAKIIDFDETINETLEPGQSKAIIENFDIDLSGVNNIKYTLE